MEPKKTVMFSYTEQKRPQTNPNRKSKEEEREIAKAIERRARMEQEYDDQFAGRLDDEDEDAIERRAEMEQRYDEWIEGQCDDDDYEP